MTNPPPLRDAAAGLDSTTAITGDGASDGATPRDGGGGDDDGGEAGATATVTGTVVSSGQGVPGVTVVIGRQSAVTGASGSFSLANVSVPYDLSVVDPAPSATEQSRVTQLVGLHGTSPVIEVLANVAPAPGTNGASLTGTVTGGAAAPNATHTGLAVQATSAADGAIGSSFAPGTAPNKNFDIAVTWPGSQASVAPVLYALQFTPDTGIPTAHGFAGVYSDPTPVTAGGAAANLVVPLTATTDSSVAGTIVAPAGYTVGVTGLVIETTNHGAFRFDQQGASSTFSFATPVAPFLSGIEIVAYASGPAGEDSYATLAVSAGTTGNALTLPLAPSTVSPASQQSAVDSSTTFSWAPVAGEHCLYEVRAHSGLGGNPDYFLKTTSTSLTLPDLSAFGAGLPAHTAYTWVVSCTLTAGAVTTDDAATTAGVVSVGYAYSGGQQFTTK